MRRIALCGIAATPLVANCGGGADGPSTDLASPILGVDLSYVNEVESCGGTYDDGGETDPFAILAARGANLVRARLWHTPDWTSFSTVDDVIETFRRAQAHGMSTLLDFHYSDEWADPGRQNPPAAWSAIDDIDELADALGAYTREVLQQLDDADVLPDMVQVGNETNGGMVKRQVGLDWGHDLPLFMAGIAAVREVSESTGHRIDVMLHVAQPENGLWWFDEAARAGLTDFDVIGLSYYPQWSRFSIEELASTVQSLAAGYGKKVLVVEAGYPWTHDDAGDTADNVLDQASPGYDISPDGQAAFMSDLTASVVANGGSGTVYWEPAWLSTDCRTRWGQGSHWENATLFDFDGRLHVGASYLAGSYEMLEPPSGEPRTIIDDEGDTPDSGADLTAVSAIADDTSVAISATIAGDVERSSGSILLAIDETENDGGDAGRRPYSFAPDDRPELLIDTAFETEPGVGYTTTTMLRWSDGDWSPETFVGRVDLARSGADRSTVTWVMPAGLASPSARVTVMTARRGRAGALADVVGAASPDAPVSMVLALGEQP